MAEPSSTMTRAEVCRADDLHKGGDTVRPSSQHQSRSNSQSGGSSIAGLLIHQTNEKMSIYQAFRKKLLPPGTALLLLEAQAATGFIIDPVTEQKLPVDEALQTGTIGSDVYNKLLAAEKAVSGYRDPSTGNTISLFEAMKKELVVRSHGMRLLEAQLATGGIIDPVSGHRLPLEVAFQQGIFDPEMNKVLSDPTDDTKGFFDPNTQENLSYLELKQRCVTEPHSGLCFLIITNKVVKGVQISTDEQSKMIFKKALVSVNSGRFSGRSVTLWEVINSEYFTAEQTSEFLRDFKLGKTTVEKIITMVSTLIQQVEKEKKVAMFHGLRRKVSAQQLLDSKIIDQKLYHKLEQGITSVKEVTELKSVDQYLTGTCSIAGILVELTNEKMSIYQAMKKQLLMPGTTLILLEAQAATGFVIDPVKNVKLTVNEAVESGLVGKELLQKLLSAERAVTGYKDPYTGNVISLFQAMKKDLIVKDHGIRLLEAQIATGGIIDPVNSHRLPVEVAYRRGMFDDQMNKVLSDAGDDTKGFFDPNTKENLTYLQLKERCLNEQNTGLRLLCLRDLRYIDMQTVANLKLNSFSVTLGKFQGRTLTFWEFLNSEYITDRMRKKIVQQYTSHSISIPQMITTFSRIIEERQRKSDAPISVDGFRKKVPIQELVISEVIRSDTYEDLQEGKITLEELLLMDSVRKYLQGDSSIAGILVDSTNEKMSIYQAMKKHLLMRGTALILLEAQAATGFVIDPVKNVKLTVDEAVESGLVGQEFHQKLLSAERAVTGYKDPYTGNMISLFQALKKDLIVKDHGIRLLEAQIATGGIIDPVNSHRLPVEVAYRRGMFDDQMNKVLSDAGDDTKGFFDPNTKENLTYLQLKERCVSDQDTGLSLLKITKGGVKNQQGYSIGEIESAFKRETICVSYGRLKGKSVTIWELIHSEYFSEEKRKELMEMYRWKEIDMKTIITRITTVIEQTESQESTVSSCVVLPTQSTVTYTAEETEAAFQERMLGFSIWYLIHSKLFTEERRTLMEKYRRKEIDLESVIRTITSLIEWTQTLVNTSITFSGLRAEISLQELVESEIIDQKTLLELQEGKKTVQDVSEKDSVKIYLKGSDSIAGILVQSTNEKMSIYQAMKKQLLMRGTALILLEAQAATGFVIDPVKNVKLTVDEAVESGLVGKEFHQKLLSAERAVTGYKDPYTGNVISLFQALKKDLIVKDHGIRLLEAQIATGGIIDPVHSHRLPIEVAYRRGMFDDQMNKVLSDAGDDTKGFFDPNTKENLTYLQLKERCVSDQDTGLSLLKITKGVVKNQQGYSIGEIESAFKRETICVSYGRLKGKSVTIWELIHSEYFSEEQRKELMEMYRWKEIDMKTIITRITTVIEQTESQESTVSSCVVFPTQGTVTYTAEETEAAFRETKLSFSIWYLIHSKLFTEEERRTLMEKYRRKEIDLESVIRTITSLIEWTQTLVDTSITFSGLRAEISLQELVESEIIDQKTLLELQEGKKTVQDVSEQDSVKIYLKGSDSIAGILVQSTNEKMSIYQAMKKQLLMRGTALILLEAQAATGFVIDPVKNVKLTVDEAVQSGLVGKEFHQKLLSAERAVTGYKDPYTGNVISLFQALKKDLIVKDHGIRLLEAQIATGGIIDPVHSHRLPVEVAYRRGMFDDQMNKVLSDAGDDTKGFFDPNTKENLTYLQLKERCVSDQDTGLSLLKITKGGVKNQQGYSIGEIESAFKRETICVSYGRLKGKSVTVWELIHSEYFSEEKRKELMEMYRWKEIDMKTIITRITTVIEQTESQESTVSSCVVLPSQSTLTDTAEETEAALQERMLGFSIWYLIHSKLFTEEERSTLMEKYRRKEIDLESVIRTTTSLIERTQTLVDTSITFSGLRAEISLQELVESEIIDQKTLLELQEGKKTVQDVSEQDSVKIYLKGSHSIAGILLQSTNEKMSIYQAMKKQLLMRGTALILLEAQAATGFVIDPVKNVKLTVDEAVESGLVGKEFHQKLLSAERAVTGYIDPYTGNVISLFQALKKDLIVKDHGIRLLEAQIATGGIIDPVHSHRLPVEVAYRRGMFDDQMNKVLSDAGDDTKGFFDPNTKENLTYLQLKERCVSDQDTGLSLLKITKGGLKNQQGYSIGEIESAFKRETMCGSYGRLKGKSVTIWELIHSEYFSEEKRKELMEMYRWKEIDMKTIITRITTVIEQTESQESTVSSCVVYPTQGTVTYTAEETEAAFRETKLSFSIWYLIHSKLFTEEERRTLMEKYRRKEIDLESVIRTITSLIEWTQTLVDTSITFSGLRAEISLQELVESEIIDQKTLLELQEGKKTVQDVSEQDSVKIYLKGSDSIAGILVQSTNEKMSIYQAMKKQLLMRGTALILLEAQAATGFVIDPVKNVKLTVDEAVQSGLVGKEFHQKLLSAERAVTGYKDPYTGNVISLFQALKKDLIVKDHGIRLLEAQIATGGIIDPVHSHRLPVEVAYRRGMFDDQMNKVLSDAGDDTKGFFDPNTKENLTYLQLKERCVSDQDTGLSLLKITKGGVKNQQGYSIGEIESAFKWEIICVSYGRLKGKSVTVWELIHSEYFSEEKRKELMEMYRWKEIDMKTIITRITTVIEQTESQESTVSSCVVLPSQSTLTDTAEETEAALQERMLGFSIWYLIHSKLFTEEERSTLMEKYRRKEIDLESVIRTTTSLIERTQTLVDTSITFSGLRAEISLQELVESEIIDQKTLLELQEGKKTVQDVSEQDSVKIYLKGSHSIAGILLQSTNEKMSIYQAMKKQLLMRGTALILLEAQAATGFVIDPVKNVKLTVDEAVESGLVGKEFHQKLLSAERAVTGYKDPYTGNVISLFQALKKDLIVKDHGIRLLEAQIATGGIIDPVHSHRLPVEVAYRRGMFDDQMNKVLSDAGDDTKGFFDPNTKENLTYLQLKERCVSDQDTGLSLLKITKGGVKNQQGYSIGEIESAFKWETMCGSCGRLKGKSVTIWELIHSEYFSEEKRKELMEMYRWKEIDMKTIITRITTVIEQTESQERTVSSCVVFPTQGTVTYTAEETEAAFRETKLSFSIWYLIHSKLFTEEERRTLMEKYRRKEIDLESVIRTITSLIEWTQTLVDTSITFSGLRAEISLQELVESEIIDQKTLLELQEGKKTVQDVSEQDSVKIYLKGSDSIAGILVQSTNEKMSIYQAMKKQLLMRGTALILLEAQAATGFVIDPVKNVKLTVDEAVESGLVGKEFHQKLLSAERAVTGYKDPYTGNVISLFQALKKDLIVKDHGIRLLEAQIATGGIIDPVHSHRLPVEVAYRRGMFDDQMNKVLSDAGDDTKGFFDPNTKENLTYLQLKERCVSDQDTGLSLLKITKGGVKNQQGYSIGEIESAFKRETICVSYGRLKGKSVTVWELIHSEYFSEEKRKELMEMYRWKEIDMKTIITRITTVIEQTESQESTVSSCVVLPSQSTLTDTAEETEAALQERMLGFSIWYLIHSKLFTEEERSTLMEKYRRKEIDLESVIRTTTSLIERTQTLVDTSITFSGLRAEISLQELVESEIIDQKTLLELQEGKKTVQDVSEQDSVKIYLKGSHSIAGILLQSTNEKMSIYQAMKKQLLMRGTALILLEAQAATGFVIDPVKNVKLTVDEAVESGLVGKEFHQKLLSAERAVTGYKDPYTGNVISLFQALKKDLIVKDHGIRLLEAQIATGGIIDPVHSHRLPVEVAYRRGMFDDQMNKVLSDAGDDTKGFFDPNTKENLTYLQLKERCVSDQDTGLSLLKITKGGVKNQQGYSIGEIESAFKRETMCGSYGRLKGKSVTIWELIHSEYFSEEKRKELMEMYRWKEIDMKTIITRITTVIEQTESQESTVSSCVVFPTQGTVTYTAEETEAAFRETKLSFSIWYLIHSKLFTEEERRTLMEKYRRKEIDLESVIRTITSLIEWTQTLVDTSITFSGLRAEISLQELVESEIIDQKTLLELQEGKKTVQDVSEQDSVKIYLKGSDSIAGILVQSTNEKMSIYQAMKKQLLMRGTALILLEAQAATGFVIDPVKNVKLTVDEAVQSGLVGKEFHQKLLSAERAVTGYKDPYTGNVISLFQALKKDLIVKDHGIRLLEAQIATGGIIDPVHSHRLPVEVAYRRGMFDDQMNKVLSDAGDDTKGFFDPNTKENLTYLQLKERCLKDPLTKLYFLLLRR
ncbi:epiplakin-like [Rhinoraja longicauda]